MMRSILFSLVVCFVLVLVACAEQTAPSANPDLLTQMFEAQDRATLAAATAQRIANQATTIAQATREFVILQGQQTRIAQDSRATQTVFAGNVNATTTARAHNQTRYADDARATLTTQNAQATATALAHQFTATAHAVNVNATQQSASATATANAVIVEATQASASATATAHAFNAQATRTSNDATATVTAAHVIAAQEKAEWDKRLEAGRAIASFAFVALVLVGLVVIVGLGAIRFIDAGVLRARVLRDKTGTVLVIGERDEHGRQAILIPGRSPGAVLALTPPEVTPLQIEAGAMDAETTKRDQAVSLMIAAAHGKGNADDLLAELTEGEQIKIVDEPPAQLVSSDTAQLLDGQWGVRVLSDGKGDQ